MTQRWRNAIRTWFGPAWIRLVQRALGPLYPSRLTYAPKGWDTHIERRSAAGWNDGTLIGVRQQGWGRIVELAQATGPLGFSYEDAEGREVHSVEYHNIHMTFAYVLALASREKSSVSVLDWGGGLGHYYLLGKALVPGVTLEYHCAEVPAMAEIGARVNAEIHWYADDRWAQRKFDLVMVNASLQYVREWKEFIGKVAGSVEKYFFLTRIPVVDRVPGFIALQHEGGVDLLHQQFNAAELVATVERTGLKLVREFIVGDRPFVRGAPEQCEMRGWLFQR